MTGGNGGGGEDGDGVETVGGGESVTMETVHCN